LYVFDRLSKEVVVQRFLQGSLVTKLNFALDLCSI